MGPETLRIGLASARMPKSRDDAVESIGRYLADAADQNVAIICFPETYLPGYRGPDFPDTPLSPHTEPTRT